MKSKKFGRRGFLKGTAALVGGLTTGVPRPASAQESGAELIHSSDLRRPNFFDFIWCLLAVSCSVALTHTQPVSKKQANKLLT